MWIECSIRLQPTPGGVYRSGQPVVGLLQYRLKKQTVFTSATIELRGKGKCSWVDSDSDSTTLYGKEKYAFLLRNILSSNNYNVPAGLYKCPIEFILPTGLPSSFKDKTGKITYKIICKFSKSGFFGSPKKFETEIYIFGDLKPCLPQPVTIGLTKTPLISSGTIDLKAKVMKTLLFAGEHIHVQCSIANNTSVPVTSIELKLVSVTTYTSNSKRKLVKRATVKGCVTERVGPNTKSADNIPCIVPTSTDLYSVQHSKVIKRDYKLQVTAVVPFPHRDESFITLSHTFWSVCVS